MGNKTVRIPKQVREMLLQLAEKYESIEFLNGDPSWFMHQVKGKKNQETMAFIASCLSYGSRKAFIPRIQYLLDCTKGEPYIWIKEGLYQQDIPDNEHCFYRLYNNHHLLLFFNALRDLYITYGGLDSYLLDSIKRKEKETGTSLLNEDKMEAIEALEAICAYFNGRGIKGIIPQNTTSCCKRVCMFLRWMVRDHSPVDLGLWSNTIDKNSLIIPLDTHVSQEAIRLRITTSKATTMKTARDITESLRKVFPNDPLRADFALFGVGINNLKI